MYKIIIEMNICFAIGRCKPLAPTCGPQLLKIKRSWFVPSCLWEAHIKYPMLLIEKSRPSP